MAEKYNGWANYETWAVHLWLSNTEIDYYAASIAARGPRAEDNLRDLTEQVVFGIDGSSPGLAADLLHAALGRVNWTAIAAAFRE